MTESRGGAEEPRKFTWFPKLTRVLKTLPQEYFAEVALAVMEYGNFGAEPEFSNPLLHSVFEGIREDVDNSLNQRYSNKGGRPPKEPAVKTRVSEVKSSSGNAEPGLPVRQGAFGKESCPGNPEPIPDHTKPYQSKEEEDEGARGAALSSSGRCGGDGGHPLPCMSLVADPAGGYCDDAGEAFSTPWDALESTWGHRVRGQPIAPFARQVARLCPPGCDRSLERVEGCARLLRRAMDRYEPGRGSAFPLARRIIEDERGF